MFDLLSQNIVSSKKICIHDKFLRILDTNWIFLMFIMFGRFKIFSKKCSTFSLPLHKTPFCGYCPPEEFLTFYYIGNLSGFQILWTVELLIAVSATTLLVDTLSLLHYKSIHPFTQFFRCFPCVILCWIFCNNLGMHSFFEIKND